MLVDLASHPLGLGEAADLCVVGAGPAGLAIAAHFIDSGYRVVVLESGGTDFEGDAQLLNWGPARGPLLDRHPLYLSSSRFRLFGGSQSAWGGWSTAWLGLDFAARPWVAHSGWPIGPAEIRPYLDQSCRLLGIDMLGDEAEGTDIFGPDLTCRRYVIVPRGRTVGAALRDRIEAAANVTVCLHATATDLERAVGSRRIARLHVATPNGKSAELAIRAVVLATGGIENARLLLASGLGNDWTGRCFMEHPHIVIGCLRSDHPATFAACYEREAEPTGNRIMMAIGLPEKVQRDHGLLNAAVQLWPETVAVEAPLRARLLLRTEQAPNPESRVSIAKGENWADLSAPQLDWLLTERDWSSVVRTAELIGTALERLPGVSVILDGLVQPWPDFPANVDHYSGWGGHHIGTTRMGMDPDTGVVDRDARVFGLDNLFVAGSSIFPTSGYANPTALLVSLAMRTASKVQLDLEQSP